MKNTIYHLLFLGVIILSGCAKEGSVSPAVTDVAAENYSGTPSSSSSGNGGGPGQQGTPGVITAGEWNDLDNWAFWLKLSDNKDYSDMQDYWKFYTDHRVSVHLTDAGGKAVTDAVVQLQKNNETLFTAKTDNRGDAELWVSLFQKEPGIDMQDLRININHGSRIISSVKSYQDGVNNIRLLSGAASPHEADISFVIDATGCISRSAVFFNPLRIGVCE